MRCPRCGEENPERARFCFACGTAFDAAESRQERKLVSVLFVDLVGFTGRSDQADPEDVRDTLKSYHSRAQREIESFGGSVEKFIGDAVMAVFGAPIVHGDDAERAVRAGLRVLEAVAELGLEARAAVNTGEAVVSVAPSATGEALAMGDVVNTASRLQNAAPAGGLVAGEETYRLARHAVTFEKLPDVVAKGKDSPVPVWLATGLVAAPVQLPRTPMVGRARELALMTSTWERAQADRRPQVMTVIGPPGIGKSRLQREFSGHVTAAGGTVLRGRCLPYGERAAYGAFAQVVRGHAGVFENDSPEEARQKVEAAIERVLPGGEVPETARYLSLLLGLGIDEPAAQRDYLFFAARRFLEGLAAGGGLLLVFEDLHWADAAVLDLLDYLARHLREAPILMLALGRPEFLDRRPEWGSGLLAHTMIGLEPLSVVDAAAMAQNLMASAPAVQERIERLAEAAEGNPLFVEELAAALTEGRDGEELPTTVRSAIAARLDALPAAARGALLDASVIGRTFWKGALAALGDHPDLDATLLALEMRDFIRRVPASRVRGDVEYLFKHILIREVAYSTLPRSLRRERHAQVARYVASATADAPDLAPLLAHHWREAGEPERAIEYLVRGAEQALDAWALEEAVALYDAALELAPDDERRRQITLARGLGRSKLGDYTAADADLGPLIPELTGRQRVEALLGWTEATEWTERAAETLAGGEEALRLAEELGEDDLVPPAMARISQALGSRGGPGDLDRSLELGERALEIWKSGTHAAALLEHQHMVGEAYYWSGRLADAEALVRAALEGFSDPHSIEARLRSAALRASVLCATGRYEDGLALFDQTMALAEELGRPTKIIQNYTTLPLRDLYELDEARRRSEDSLEGALGWEGFTMPRANAMADLVQTAILAGDFATARRAWQEQWDDSSRTQGWARWLIPCRLAAARAELELVTGHLDAALEWARKSIELCVPARRLKYEAVGRTLLGRALLAAGQAVEAVSELRLGAERADRLGSPTQRWQARAALGEGLYAIGEDNGAEAAFGEAAAILVELAAGLRPDRRARFLAAEPVRAVLGKSRQPADQVLPDGPG